MFFHLLRAEYLVVVRGADRVLIVTATEQTHQLQDQNNFQIPRQITNFIALRPKAMSMQEAGDMSVTRDSAVDEESVHDDEAMAQNR